MHVCMYVSIYLSIFVCKYVCMLKRPYRYVGIMQICILKRIKYEHKGDARGITLTVIRNGHSQPSSNPG